MAKKIKEWYEEHKQDIREFGFYAAGVAVGITSMIVGQKLCVRNAKPITVVTDKDIENTLLAAQNAYGISGMRVYTGWTSTGFKPNELGELGKRITDLGGANNTFTHFLAIGPKNSK